MLHMAGLEPQKRTEDQRLMRQKRVHANAESADHERLPQVGWSLLRSHENGATATRLRSGREIPHRHGGPPTSPAARKTWPGRFFLWSHDRGKNRIQNVIFKPCVYAGFCRKLKKNAF